ncbi:MAG: HD domain-containing protein [Deltaproteobacteria bacterium]|nr:HD domain-containing protein [Deltaproteobacteria bacterium]MBW2626680.1 HD domain-containing protein [Deltaproteobacteria bacterium]
MPDRILRQQIASPVLDICKELRNAGERAWVVGGCVRDTLRGQRVNDWDVATTALPEKVQQTFRKVIPTGIDHGTVTVLWKGGAYEVTTLRGDGTYTDGRRPDSVVFVEDIDRDLARRDFTVNAIAYDPVEGRVADPFDGLADMRDQVLRAVGEPSERFQEDGLRILRGARFVATLGFELEEATEAAFRGALDTFRKVSPERVRDEWLKAMKANTPSRAFEVMRRTGILEVTYPELLEQVGCEQNQWHAYDVWDHTMRVLDESVNDPVERVAALLHDVAKPRTRAKSDKTNDWTFYHHEKVGADMAERWLRDYRFSNQERKLVVGLIRHHLICYTSQWTDAAVRRFIKRVGTDGVEPLLRLGKADALGKGRNVEEELAALKELRDRVDKAMEEGNALTIQDLAIGGNDVIEHLEGGAGPAVGEILRDLLDRVIEDPSLNTRDKLMPIVEELAAKQGQ